MSAADFNFGGVNVARGQRAIARVSVTTRLDGSELVIPVHVIAGRESGPVLTVVSALHGSEWFSIEVVRQLVEKVAAVDLKGTLLAVPVANPMGLEQFTRMTPDESDEPDLNRVWPGGQTWITEQIAGALSRDVLSRSDALIDIHTGPYGASLGAVGYGLDVPDAKVALASAELAVAFGYPAIRALRVMGQFPGPRSITGYVSSTLGIPSIGPNVGGAGFAPQVEADWIGANVNGALGVMKHLGMLPGEPARPPRFFHFETRGHRVVPRRAGLLLPRIGPERLVTEVEKGTVLGEVVSPYTFETLEQLVAPVDGVLFGVGRMTPLRPGDWAYFVAEGSAKSSRWVAAEGSTREIAKRMLEGASVTSSR